MKSHKLDRLSLSALTRAGVLSVAITFEVLLCTERVDAAAQCPGRITGIASEEDNSLTVQLNPEIDCGCQYNRLNVPGNAANLRSTHANVLAAFLAGMRVSILYDWNAATPCYNCGACLIHNVSVVMP